MANPLSITGQRAGEAAKYQNYNRLLADGGIAALSRSQIVEYELLARMAANGELDGGVLSVGNEEILKRLTAQRVQSWQQNVQDGQPPFQPHFSFWTWNPKRRVFLGNGPISGLELIPPNLVGNIPYAECLRSSRVDIQ